jgi:arylsulfatase A-like enzyme
VQDVLAGLDDTIGRLLDVLDRTVGRERYVVALSADHGVATIPEQLAGDGTSAGRVSLNDLTRRAEAAIAQSLEAPGPYVARVEYTYLYLRPGVIDRLRARPGALERVKAAIAAARGIAGVLVGADLDFRHPSPDRVTEAAALSQYPPRSGDLILLPALNWFFVQGDGMAGGTTHGTAHPYDARVPVLFYGAGIRPGTYDGPAAPIDIAPTLARLCGVDLPAATGHVLEQALRPPAAGSAAVRP